MQIFGAIDFIKLLAHKSVTYITYSMKCLACNSDIKYAGELLACTGCKGSYHYSCNNITTAHFNQNSHEIKKIWKCPSCNRPARKDDNTPLRKQNVSAKEPAVTKAKERSVSDSSVNVNTAPRKRTNVSPSLQVDSSGEHEVKSSNSSEVSCELTLPQLQRMFAELSDSMKALADSLGACRSDMASFRSELCGMREKMERFECYESEVKDLRDEVHCLREELKNRDRQQVQNDIEISGLNEKNGENLSHTVGVIALKLGVELDPRDVVYVSRVGRRQSQDNDRPRPVVARFTRRTPRDQLLQAARVRRHLTTDMFDVPGSPRVVYLNEHLIKSDRQLYGKARAALREGKLKFVWKRNGHILIRKTEQGPVHRVQSEDDLCRITTSLDVTFRG